MYEGKLVFSQLMDHLPQQTFRRLVERYGAIGPCGHSVARTNFAAWPSRS